MTTNFFDVSEWEEHAYYGTGGTRNKVILENPTDGKLYYFKTSLNKGQKNYTYEFWSEVVASAIGAQLKFDILIYDVAFYKNTLGCLSKSMLDTDKSQLDEGYKWIKQYQESYNTENREEYTFQIIDETLNKIFPNHQFINNIISTIIFDSIIGNEDRHQENWGILVSTQQKEFSGLFSKRTIEQRTTYTFAPMYDNGSSLGRELNDDKVNQMLKDNNQLMSYIARGQSEIHWSGIHGKQKHFDLISKIAETNYKPIVISEIDRIRSLYKKSIIEDIIQHIDDCLPPYLESLKIPQNRKELLIKLVILRVERLLSLL